jgi:hypothetical protein
VGLAVRFARERLGARQVSIEGAGDAFLLAQAAAAVWPGVSVIPSRDPKAFSWKEAVEELREVWPIHYLVPGGAAVRLDAGRAP